jgi:hypothetical protein
MPRYASFQSGRIRQAGRYDAYDLGTTPDRGGDEKTWHIIGPNVDGPGKLLAGQGRPNIVAEAIVAPDKVGEVAGDDGPLPIIDRDIPYGGL